MGFDGETGRSMKSCHMNHHGEGGREGEGGERREGEGEGRGGREIENCVSYSFLHL